MKLINIREFGSTENALKALLEDNIYSNNVCITSLPVNNFSFRNIRLPFKDKKKISQTIPYEIEPLLPYPVDDLLIDYVITNQLDQSDIIAAAIPKSDVKDLFQILNEYQIEATVIDIDSVPVALKLLNSGIATGCGLLLDVGTRDTSCIIFNEGKISHLRHYAFEGEETTNAIAEKTGIRFDEAEKRKKAFKSSGSNDVINGIYQKFLGEIKNTLQFLRLKGELKSEISEIFLTGGGAIDPLLGQGIENLFSIPVETVDISETDDIRFEGETGEVWNPMIMNNALALATRETKKAGGFNYAVGKFGPKKKYEKFKKDFTWIGATILVILFLFGINFYADYHYNRAYVKQLKYETRDIFKKTFPEVTRIVDPVQQMKVRIAEAKKSSITSSRIGGESTVLDILKDMSRLVPPSTDFIVKNFTFDGDTVEIKGETDNFNTVDNIKSYLGKSIYLTNVKISSASLMKKGKRVGFNLKMELK
jgi:general secretion pathway protein L